MNRADSVMDDHDVVQCIRRVGGGTLEVSPDDGEGLTVCICTYKRPAALCQFLRSLAQHDTKPARLVIVDASPDDRTRDAFLAYERIEDIADETVYYHVRGDLETLTCSRNFAITCVATDWLVFFDDDIVLKPGCLKEMVKVHQEFGDQVVGVGALDVHGVKTPSAMWRIRRLLGIVSTLRPGAYTRAGISIPWTFQGPTEETLEADWLSGCCMMWRTAIVNQVRFNEDFGGHSTGEDLDVSLRMARHGRLMVSGKAHILHLHESAGRPNMSMMAYSGIRNAYDIHCRCLPNRSFLDATWFMYAYGTDTLLRGIMLLRPGGISLRWDFLRGRMRFFRECLWPFGRNARSTGSEPTG